MATKIDHIVVGASDLHQGMLYIKNTLGVDIPFGGVHMKMGTHNLLMKLGDGIFFEVIAINPDIEAPDRPRWFGLDDPYIQAWIKKEPLLLTWVVNTGDIAALLKNAALSFGQPEPVSRGNLNWLFGLPHDGRLISGGILPYVMQWQTDVHPSGNMSDLNCRLETISIHHPHPEWIQSVLQSIGASGLVNIYELPNNTLPYLETSINTPVGTKRLVSAGKLVSENSS